MFVALRVPREQALAFAEVLDALAARGARVVPVDRLHLTAAFMRAVPQSHVATVSECLCRVAGRTAPFTLATTGAVDRFGARVAWAALRPSQAAAAFADGLQASLAGAGLALPVRPFRPHLTLARAGRRRIDRRMVDDLAAPEVSWRVEHADLIDSVLGSGRAEWREVAAPDFTGGG